MVYRAHKKKIDFLLLVHVNLSSSFLLSGQNIVDDVTKDDLRADDFHLRSHTVFENCTLCNNNNRSPDLAQKLKVIIDSALKAT